MFVAVRVGEIHEKYSIEEWLWTKSRNNVADMVTKPCEISELSTGGRWQEGPAFLIEEISSWPITHSVVAAAVSIPNLKVNIRFFSTTANIHSMGIELSRFNSFTELVRVQARVIAAVKGKSFKWLLGIISVDHMRDAEKALIAGVQKGLGDWDTTFKRLSPFKSDGIVYVGGRIKGWLKDSWSQKGYALLPGDVPLSWSIVQEAHDATHEGFETTLTKLLSNFWIPRARKLTKGVKDDFVKCRMLKKKVVY